MIPKNQFGAILLDTRSIQKYVFSCNKLKTNIGASFLVDRIFTNFMKQVLDESELAISEKSWEAYTREKENKPENQVELQMLEKGNENLTAEIAYIGGGNMLILLRPLAGEAEKSILARCKQLVREWSLKVLMMAPGLKTGAAIGLLDVSPEHFKSSLDTLYKQLKVHQNMILPQVDLPYTGLTLTCDYTGKVANERVWGDENRWISAEVAAKEQAYRAFEEGFSKTINLPPEYEVASDIQDLGYLSGKNSSHENSSGESYICVIHIDGNNMGVKFSHCRGMQERRALSLKIANIVKDGFNNLLQDIVADCKNGSYKKWLRLVKDGEKTILPIRPIIIGGDDVTFVCAGRVGLLYAQRFIEYVSKQEILNKDLLEAVNQSNQKDHSGDKRINSTMSCCGGIAIVPATYPFYRAYELAEQLCDSAKKKSRKYDGSLIDFAVLHGQMTPQLSQLERQNYRAPMGFLHAGPYLVAGKGDSDTEKIDDLKRVYTVLFSGTLSQKEIARNKVKQLRQVLLQNRHSQTLFLEHCSEMKLEKVEDLWTLRNEESGELVTPYMDAIELERFVIPEFMKG